MTKDEIKFMKNHSKVIIDAIETVMIILEEQKKIAEKNYEIFKELSKPVK